MAGGPPSEWFTPQGTPTTDEELLSLHGFRLRIDQRARHRLVKRSGEQLDRWLDPADARDYNTLIYNVSDDRIHHFQLDVGALNHEIRNTLRDRIVRDLRTTVGENDLLLVTSDHGFVELDATEARELPQPGKATQVNYRLVQGARLTASGV